MTNFFFHMITKTVVVCAIDRRDNLANRNIFATKWKGKEDHWQCDPKVDFLRRPGEAGLLERKHICHIPGCEKTFRTPFLLRAHVCQHTGQRPFVCNWPSCDKSFTRPDELQRHVRVKHTGYQPEQRVACTCPNCKDADKRQGYNSLGCFILV